MPTKPTRAQLIAKWKKIVEQIENGYSLGLYDYRNDLDVRSLLAEAGGPPSPLLDELDARFRAATHKRKLKVWESDSADPFWIYGIPKRTTPEFKQYLQAENLA